VPVPACQQRVELFALRRLDHVIRIEPEGIIARGVCQRLVPRRGEVIDPGKLKDTRSEFAGDLDRAIGAARIDNNDLIEHPPHRFQAMRQVFFLNSVGAILVMFRPPTALRGQL
jgi:hypothetical protein